MLNPHTGAKCMIATEEEAMDFLSLCRAIAENGCTDEICRLTSRVEEMNRRLVPVEEFDRLYPHLALHEDDLARMLVAERMVYTCFDEEQ